MSSPEQGDRHQLDALFMANEPLVPSPLPPELAEFLHDRPYACILNSSDHGALFVVKAPRREIVSAQGSFPIRMTHELHDHPAAPVIRMVTTLYDQPSRPMRFESFINVGDPDQRATYATLSQQDETHFLFYDEGLRHSLSKRVAGLNQEQMQDVLRRAGELAARIAPQALDFDEAKAAVMERTRL